MKRFLFIVSVLLFAPLFIRAQLQEAVVKLQQKPGLKHAAIGISVKRMDGQTVLDYHGSMALVPASVTKLFSTAFALKTKGTQFTYCTKAFYSGEIHEGVLEGNILIQAGGDPCLDSRYFPAHRFVDTVVAGIESLGIKRVAGKIIVMEGEKEAYIPGSWPWEDIANYYGTLYHPFNYRDNSYTIKIRTRRSDKSAEIVSVRPKVPQVTFRTEVVVDPANSNDVWLYGGPTASVIVIRGTFSTKPSVFSLKGAMHHPAEVFVGEVTERLLARGVIVDGDSIPSRSSHEFLSRESPVLGEIVFQTNKRSVNLFAEALGRLVDAENFEHGVKKHLSMIPTDTSGIILKDACGLSPLNAVPAETFTDLLVWGYQHLDKSFFYSLPQGGVDGGLHIYADHPSLGSRLRAKTGSFSGVRALSGYLVTQRKERLAFTILINHYTCTSKEIREAVRDFLVALSESFV